MDFNISNIAAILTIAGYSINDTVVIYDRIRENLRKFKKMNLVELLNLSINNTLSRTVMTSLNFTQMTYIKTQQLTHHYILLLIL